MSCINWYWVLYKLALGKGWHPILLQGNQSYNISTCFLSKALTNLFLYFTTFLKSSNWNRFKISTCYTSCNKRKQCLKILAKYTPSSNAQTGCKKFHNLVKARLNMSSCAFQKEESSRKLICHITSLNGS